MEATTIIEIIRTALASYIENCSGQGTEETQEIEAAWAALQEREKSQHSLCEAVADISFLAGQHDFYSGDMRKNIELFIEWAQEFQTQHKDIEWGINSEMDYADTIYSFALAKFESNDMSNPQTIANCIKRAVEYAKQCQQEGLLVNTNIQDFNEMQEQSVRDLETIYSIHSLYANDCIHAHRTDEILIALIAEFPFHA